MTSDEFVRALLDSAKRDVAPPGARARAMTALHSALTTTGGTVMLKLLIGVVLVVGATGVGVAALARRDDAAPIASKQARPTPSSESHVAIVSTARPALAQSLRRMDRLSSPLPAASNGKSCSTWGHPVRMVVENQLAVPIDLFWMSYDCEEVPAAHGLIEAGATYEGLSFDTAPFRVRDRRSHRLIKEIAPMSPDPDTARIIVDGSQAPIDGPPLVCSTEPTRDQVRLIVNARSTPIEALWIDYRCNEVSYGEIEPGEERELDTYNTHPWRFRDLATNELLEDVAPEPIDEWKEWKITIP
jgi:hypothetical protein